MQENATTSGTRVNQLGHWLMPPPFLLFFVLAVVCGAAGISLLGWQTGIMAGFDVACACFLLAVLPLFDRRTEDMRRVAERNDANRVLLLTMTVGVLFVILVTVATELAGRGKPDMGATVLVIVTLVLAWTFVTIVYTLHYAHLYYLQTPEGKDRAGLAFPQKPEPDYWDFLYFSCTMGMTFQTSDVEITASGIRRIVLFHGLAAFVFNLGVLAFTINVLGSG